MSNKFLIITIDGGAASGKSSTAHGVAERLGLLHVDTGSHYRAVTLLALREGINPENEAALAELLKQNPLGAQIAHRSALVTIGTEVPVDEALRSPEVNEAVSKVAAAPAVREALREYQRGHAKLAQEAGLPGLVMEGRDIGSVIFPEAPVKIFLDADTGTRAKRRAEEGQMDSIEDRDRQDSERKTAPLACPPDAHRIDTGSLNLQQVVNEVCLLAQHTPL